MEKEISRTERKNNKKQSRQDKPKKNIKKILINIVLSLIASFLVTLIVVFVPPLVSGVTLVSDKPMHVAIVFIVLEFVYFVVLSIVERSRYKAWIKATISIVSGLIATILVIAGMYFANTMVFIRDTEVGEYDNIVYSVVVRKDSSYKTVGDLRGQKIEMMKGVDESGIHTMLQRNTKFNYIY